jgi:hypothetical protein
MYMPAEPDPAQPLGSDSASSSGTRSPLNSRQEHPQKAGLTDRVKAASLTAKVLADLRASSSLR